MVTSRRHPRKGTAPDQPLMATAKFPINKTEAKVRSYAGAGPDNVMVVAKGPEPSSSKKRAALPSYKHDEALKLLPRCKARLQAWQGRSVAVM